MRCSLSVERLENRDMLAGNVAVTVDGDNLFLLGDNNANAVMIVPGTVPNAVLLLSMDGTTTFNGQSHFQFVFPGQFDIDAKLGGGADQLMIEAARNGQRLAIDELFANMGAGNDTTVLKDVSCRLIDVRTGNGADLIDLTNIQASQTVNVEMARGNDRLHAVATRVTGMTKFDLGGGINKTRLRDVYFGILNQDV